MSYISNVIFEISKKGFILFYNEVYIIYFCSGISYFQYINLTIFVLILFFFFIYYFIKKYTFKYVLIFIIKRVVFSLLLFFFFYVFSGFTYCKSSINEHIINTFNSDGRKIVVASLVLGIVCFVAYKYYYSPVLFSHNLLTNKLDLTNLSHKEIIALNRKIYISSGLNHSYKSIKLPKDNFIIDNVIFDITLKNLNAIQKHIFFKNNEKIHKYVHDVIEYKSCLLKYKTDLRLKTNYNDNFSIELLKFQNAYNFEIFKQCKFSHKSFEIYVQELFEIGEDYKQLNMFWAPKFSTKFEKISLLNEHLNNLIFKISDVENPSLIVTDITVLVENLKEINLFLEILNYSYNELYALGNVITHMEIKNPGRNFPEIMVHLDRVAELALKIDDMFIKIDNHVNLATLELEKINIDLINKPENIEFPSLDKIDISLTLKELYFYELKFALVNTGTIVFYPILFFFNKFFGVINPISFLNFKEAILYFITFKFFF